MSKCKYVLTLPSGEVITKFGKAAMKAYLVQEGMSLFYPDGKYPWLQDTNQNDSSTALQQGAPSKPIEDAGEKIGGARKDRWKERGLNLEDLDAMTEAEGAELATKANVWKPDYEALASAAEPVTAAMVKTIYDKLAAKPAKNTPEGRRQYVQMMRIVRDAYTEAKGPEAVKNAYLEIRKRAGVNTTDPQAKAAARELLFSVYKGRSDPFVLGYNEASKAKKLVEDGFPAKAEPWKSRLTVGRLEGGPGTTERGFAMYTELSAEVGTPLTREQIAEGFFRVTDKKNKTVAFAPTKEDAEAAAKTVYERDMKGGKDEKPEPVRPHLDEMKRENLPQRIDRDVTSEDFVRDLGFRGVEFGNWSAQDERQRILNMAYDGLMDLAEIMGVPPKAMSLNGTLGMAFGARGGGKFAAHYEPGKLVINMTKIRGGGSMAHEWAHAMDHYFGELDKPDAYTTQARGASGWMSEDQYQGVPRKRMEKIGGEWKNVEKMRLDNLRPELASAFDEVMRALFQQQLTKAEMVRSQELDLERTEALAQKEQDADLKAMYQRMAENKRQALEELRQDPEDKMYAGRGRSEYANQAQALSGKSTNGYWTRPTEMFARAFESWVFDKVTAMGARSDYLVHGVEEDRFAGGGYKGNPYPTGAERARINAAFDRLADTIQTKETDKGVMLFSRGAASPKTPATEIRQAITKAYGDLLEKLEGKGLVTLAQTEEQAIEAAAQVGGDVAQIKRSLMGVARRSMGNNGAMPDKQAPGPQGDARKGAKTGNVVAADAIPDERDGFVRLNHSGSDQVDGSYFSQVPSGGVFDGFFALMGEFGNYGTGAKYFTDIPEEKLLSNYALNYDIPYEDVYAAFESVTGIKDDADEFDVVWRAVIEDKGDVGDDDLVNAFGSDDWGEASWYAQKLRGQVAKALGFQAVEMSDENGTSYLIVSGTPLTRVVENESSASVSDDAIDVKRSANGAVQGFFDPQTGQSFLIADNLTAEAGPGVLMHEVGIHMAADGTMQPLFDRASRLLKAQKGNPFMQRVQARMDAAKETSGEEATAYIVEAYENDRAQAPASVRKWLGDLLAAVKAWLYQKGFMGADRLTVADIAAVARANAKSIAVRDASKDAQPEGIDYSVVQQLQSDNFYEAYRRALESGRTLRENEITEGLAGKSKGGQRRGVLSFAGAKNPSTATVFWESEVLGGGYYTTAMMRGKAGKREFIMFAIPERAAPEGTPEQLTDAVRSNKVILHTAARELGDGSWEFAVDGAHPTSPYYDELIARGELEPVANGYHRLKIPGASNNDFLRETARRLSMALDGKTPDIRYERATGWNTKRGDVVVPASKVELKFSRKFSEVKDQAMQSISKVMDHPGDLHWWHKTVGTMNNLAERSPAFKRVFDAAQGFLDDVSHYATDAADMAPKLLPQLETMKDVFKQPISAEDNRAIQAPIFEGTLAWARDRDGAPVLVEDMEKVAATLTADQKGQELLRNNAIDPRVLRAWRGLPLEKYERFVSARYASKLMAPGIVWTDAELRTMFNLNDGQIELYREFRDATDRSMDNMARADMLRFGGEDLKPLKKKVMEAADAREAVRIIGDYLKDVAQAIPDREGQMMDIMKGVNDRYDRLKDLQAKGYAPLMRFGEYTVDVVVDGDRKYFGMFATKAESNAMAERMRAEHGDDAVTQGAISKQEHLLMQGINPETLELFGNMLGLESDGDTARDQVFQKYLQKAKSSRSAMKRLIHRKGVAGYSDDVGRVLASFVYSNARQTAAGLHMGELGEAVDAIPKGQGQLKDAAIGLAEYVKNPKEEGQAVRGLLFAQYLGASVAAASLNMLQPTQVTFPWLTQFTSVKNAAGQLAKAAKNMASKGYEYEADLAKALKAAEDDGTVSPQEVHQLMRQAGGGGSMRVKDGTRMGDLRAEVANKLEVLKFGWGGLFGAAEQINRRMTFIAAYRIAKENDLSNPEAFARKAVVETQFAYTKANKPKWARSAIGGTLFTFKTFSISYLELMHRMWNAGTPGSPERAAGRRAVGIMMVMLLLLSGMSGLPFAEDAEDLATAAGQMMGYNFDAKQKRNEFIRSMLGSQMADFLDRGFSGIPGVPLDVSGRLGLGNLIPGSGVFKNTSREFEDFFELLGPVGSLARDSVKGLKLALSGNVTSGLAQVSPVAARNLIKGADMAAMGMYRDQKGYKVLDTTMLEAALKSIGFQPSSVAKEQDKTAAVKQAIDYYNLKAGEIRSLWAAGIFERDPDKVQQARDTIAAWNAKNPDLPMRVYMPSVAKRVREMGKPRSDRVVETAPQVLREAFRDRVEEAEEMD